MIHSRPEDDRPTSTTADEAQDRSATAELVLTAPLEGLFEAALRGAAAAVGALLEA